jgi:DNA-3-methyladenine glycosylase II
LLVELPDPFDFELTTERFRAFGADPATVWEDGRLHRVFEGAEVAIGPAAGGVEIEPGTPALAAAVRRFLGATFDLDGLLRLAASDSVLARVVSALQGLRPTLVPDPWEMLVGSVTAQQVSLHAATAIRARLVARYGTRHDRAYAFPTRELLAAAEPEELLPLGFSRRKAEYVVGLARSPLDLDGLAALPDEEVKASLTSVRGLGEWSADWFLARHLGRPAAWPAGDLAVRKAVSALYLDGRDVSIAEVRAFGERFGEQRSLVVHYLLVGHRVLGG